MRHAVSHLPAYTVDRLQAEREKKGGTLKKGQSSYNEGDVARQKTDYDPTKRKICEQRNH